VIDFDRLIAGLREMKRDGCSRTDPAYGTCYAPHDYKRAARPQEPDPVEDWCKSCIATVALIHIARQAVSA
jgi:hypothetical protein